MKQSLDNQEVMELEGYLRKQLAAEPQGGQVEEFSLADLRTAAGKLSSERQKEIIEEVTQITEETSRHFAERQESVADARRKQSVMAKWGRYIAGVAAVALLVVMAPIAVNGAVDFPGVGTWIQQAVLRDSGLSWAYENGYVKGTMAQSSLDGVTLRILGVVADPVQTTVIYLLQGVDTATRGEAEVPSVSITRVDRTGVASWSIPGNRTMFGQVGIVSTGPLAQGRSTLEVSLVSSGTSRLSLTIEADREELSRLATITDLNAVASLKGIEVVGQRLTVTPTQVVVEYTVSGGQFAQGLIPEDMTLKLITASGQEITASSSHGPVIDGVRHLRTVFDRPADLGGARLVMPTMAKFENAEVAWTLNNGQAVSEDAGSVSLRNVSIRDGQLEFEMVIDRSAEVWNFHGFEVENAAGEVHALGHNRSNWWHPGESDNTAVIGTRVALPEGFVPVIIRATEAEILVEGPWIIDLGQSK